MKVKQTYLWREAVRRNQWVQQMLNPGHRHNVIARYKLAKEQAKKPQKA